MATILQHSRKWMLGVLCATTLVASADPLVDRDFSTNDPSASGSLHPKERPRLHLPLAISFYVKNKPGSKEMFTRQAPKRYMLKSMMDRTNYFDLDDLRVETAPLAKVGDGWQLTLMISKKNTLSAVVDEHLAVLKLTGTLQKNHAGLIFLTGFATTQVQDKFAQPLFAVELGQQ